MCLSCVVFLASNCTFADTISSDYITYNAGRYTYKANSSISTGRAYDLNGVRAYADISCVNNNAPYHSFGVQARLFTRDGVLKTASKMTYNEEELGGMSVSTGLFLLSGNYISMGRIDVYNTKFGDNVGIDALATRFVTVSNKNQIAGFESFSDSVLTYQLNQNGETYGSEKVAENLGKDPDLITAYGTDGTLGYVKSSDLTSTLDLIPLYKNDGQTIIGSFKIEKGQVEYKK